MIFDFLLYVPADWYWIIAEDKVWSSSARAYVPRDDPTFIAWQERGGIATPIASEAELNVVLYDAGCGERAPAPRWQVPKTTIVARLKAVNLFDAAASALAGNQAASAMWAVGPAINSDDQATAGLLEAIGADPAVILAPET